MELNMLADCVADICQLAKLANLLATNTIMPQSTSTYF